MKGGVITCFAFQNKNMKYTIKDIRCQNCKYGSKGFDYYTCQRYPPKLITRKRKVETDSIGEIIEEITTRFPMVSGGDFCGEFKNKNVET